MNNPVPFEIHGSVLGDFPEASVLAFCADVAGAVGLDQLNEVLHPRLEEASQALADVEPITSLPAIAEWRTAYQKLGVKPSKFTSSIEALLRRVKKGGLGVVGIPVVDLYNSISVLNQVPMGAYDVDRLDNVPIVLRHADPETDRYSPLGGDANSFPLNPKLVIYGQGETLLCWGFNTRDSANHAVEGTSQRVVFFSESTTSRGAEASYAALQELAALLRGAGCNVGEIAVANAGDPKGIATL